MAVMAHELGDSRMLTPGEYERLIEERCQAWLGMDLTEFKRRLNDGELPDTPAVGHILLLLGVGA
jgi:hypothetical protein